MCVPLLSGSKLNKQNGQSSLLHCVIQLFKRPKQPSVTKTPDILPYSETTTILELCFSPGSTYTYVL